MTAATIILHPTVSTSHQSWGRSLLLAVTKKFVSQLSSVARSREMVDGDQLWSGPLPLAIEKIPAYLIAMDATSALKLKRPAKNAKLDVPRYLLGDLAAATGMTENVLKAWLSREPKVIPLGPHDKPGRGKGSSREFTLRRVISVAIAAELVRLGITPGRAGLWAYTLTDVKVGPTDVDWLDEGTVLFASPNTDTFAFGTKGTSIAEALEKFPVPTPDDTEPPASLAVVGYGAILRRVRERLAARGKLDEGF